LNLSTFFFVTFFFWKVSKPEKMLPSLSKCAQVQASKKKEKKDTKEVLARIFNYPQAPLSVYPLANHWYQKHNRGCLTRRRRAGRIQVS
jgi:hypothetical protein